MGSELNVTVGALLIGVLVTAVAFGITMKQTHMYMGRFPKDPWLIRWMVWSLLLLDTAHVALSWHMIYYYLILNFGDRATLEDSVWSFDITIIITAIITVIVHLFYARRVYILSGKNWFITGLILVLSVIRVVFGCLVSDKMFELRKFKLLPHEVAGIVGVALGAGTLADCVITGMLIYYLQKYKSGFNQRLDSFLDKITYWTVNNGMLPSVAGFIVIIALVTMPNNMIFLSAHLLLSKLYANSLLGSLNFRPARRGRGLDTDGTMFGASRTAGPTSAILFAKDDESTIFNQPIRLFSTQARQATSTNARSGPVVHIVTTTSTQHDYLTYTSPIKGTLEKDESPSRALDYDFGADSPAPSDKAEPLYSA